MTRETKAGIVISGAFLALLGTVLKHRMQAGDEAADGPPKLVAQAPEKEKPSHPTTGADGSRELMGPPETLAATSVQLAAFNVPAPQPLPLGPLPSQSSPSVSVSVPMGPTASAPAVPAFELAPPAPPPSPPVSAPLASIPDFPDRKTTGWATWLAAVPAATNTVAPPPTLVVPPPAPVEPPTASLLPTVTPPTVPVIAPPQDIMPPSAPMMPPVNPPTVAAPPPPPALPTIVPPSAPVTPPFPTAAPPVVPPPSPPAVPVERTAPIASDPNDNHSHFIPKNPTGVAPPLVPLVPLPSGPPTEPTTPMPIPSLPPSGPTTQPPAFPPPDRLGISMRPLVGGPTPLPPSPPVDTAVKQIGAVDPRPAPLQPPLTPPPLTKPAVTVTEETRVAAQPGDTFERIALREYKDAGYAPLLQSFTQSDLFASEAMKAGKFQPGDKILIPPASELVKSSPARGPSGDTSTVRVAPPAAPPTLPKYKVISPGGETFYEIGKAVLRDENGSLRIQPLNQQYDPLKPVPAGTILTMPEGTAVPPANRP